MKKITINEAETNAFGADFLDGLKPGDVVALYGKLGAGKTVFTKGLARGLGIQDRVSSPTFTLMKDYRLPGKEGRFYHLDLYRLESAKDLKAVDVKELMSERNNIIVIEWAEKAKKLVPKDAVEVRFKILPAGKREIVVTDNRK